MLGVGRATEKVLSDYGIHTIGELAATSDDCLKCRLGKNGLAIKKYANGLDDSPVMRFDYVSPVKSIGHGITTMQDLENNAEVWCVMLELVQEIGTNLKVSFQKLSSDGSIYGLTAYVDTEYQIEVDGSQKSVFLKTNDVVLDKSFIEPENIRKLCGKRRFTLAHECAHQILFQLDADDRKIALP